MTSTGGIEHRPPFPSPSRLPAPPSLTPCALPDARNGESAFPNQGKTLSPLHRATQAHDKSFWKDVGGA